MGIYYQDPMVTLYQGDVRAVLRELPAESVQMVVTSPPYWSLRDYGIEPSVWGGPSGEGECEHEWGEMKMSTANDSNRGGMEWTTGGAPGTKVNGSPSPQGQFCLRCGAWRGALGLEPTPEMFIAHMVEVFREVKRVLRRDGTLWLNIGDSYAGGGGYSPDAPSNQNGSKQSTSQGSKAGVPLPRNLKPKDLVGIPWMLAFALRADGWWLRSDIIWAKPNPMPESVNDRPTKSHEYLFLLSKSANYYYDADAVREAYSPETLADQRHIRAGTDETLYGQQNGKAQGLGRGPRMGDPAGRNKRSVWTIATEPFPEAHFATYPQALVRPCVLAGTSERGACAECGAPWERVTERGELVIAANGDKHAYPSPRSDAMDQGVNRSATHLSKAHYERTHTGWQRPCGHHDAPTVPCTVLDPFAGSGTTMLVAKSLGRRAIGIDLNAEYLAMSRKRIERVTLPMALA